MFGDYALNVGYSKAY